MSGYQFTFPPPPPAPPTAGPNGYRGREDSRGYGNRGTGRGPNGGGQRSGHFGSSQSSSSYVNPSIGTDKRHSSPLNTGFRIQKDDYRRSGYPLPSYPSMQLPQVPINVRQSYGPQNQVFPANAQPPEAAYPADGSSSYHNGQHPYPSPGYGPSLPTIQGPVRAAQNTSSFQSNAHTGQPVLMGPPIRMGFDARRNSSQTWQHTRPTANETSAFRHGPSDGNQSPYRHSSPMNFHPGHHGPPSAFPGSHSRGQKHGYGETYSRSRHQNQRTQVAPAVPSFGIPLPLPLKPPPLHGITRKPRKKKRKHNQLGLTPKAEEHESSDDEDDTDEEARLAAGAASAGQGHQLLQFDYKGRTSTLQSSSDIAAWIEERKRRYPTKARTAKIIEGKPQSKKRQRSTDQVSREAQETHGLEDRKRKRRDTEREKQQKKGGNASEDAAARSKRKVERLRKQLEKEEQRIAQAEAKASRWKVERSAEVSRTEMSALSNEDQKKRRSESGDSGNVSVEDTNLVKLKLQEAAITVPDPLTPTSQPALADEEQNLLPKALNAHGSPSQVNPSIGQEGNEPSVSGIDRSIHDSSVYSKSNSSSEFSSTDSEDNTSSSGSSSDGDSDDNAPIETSTKREGPERVAPPKRAMSKQICRTFLQRGHCKRGSSCKYLHELPERGSHGRGHDGVNRATGRKERIGLHQRLVEREKEREDHEIMEAILHLGEKGF